MVDKWTEISCPMLYQLLQQQLLLLYKVFGWTQNTIQNSGVTLEVELLQLLTLKDQNLVVGSMSYYSVIEETWEIAILSFMF